METIRPDSLSAGLLAEAAGGTAFTLIDIGCSGGVDPAWAAFGDSLRVFAFDPGRAEIERLAAGEIWPDVHYINGFVGLPIGDPRKGASVEPWRLDPWGRLSAHRTQDIQRGLAEADQAQTEDDVAPAQTVDPAPSDSGIAATDEGLMQLNRWHEASLASPDQPIVLPQFLASAGVTDVDFIKIDVDGADFEILQSLGPLLDSHGVLGMALEVNFHGSAEPQYNTFHNIDRFMRAHGFDLFDLSIRKYALAVLPRPYLHAHPFAGQTTGGRPFQGDALYLRDLNHRRLASSGPAWSDDKLLKLAALFSLFGLADHAAEILLQFRDRLAGRLNIDEALDRMAAETQAADADLWGERRFEDYAAYVAAFERDDPAFYGADARRREAPHRTRKDRDAALAHAARLEAELAERDRRIEELGRVAAAAAETAQTMRRSLSWRLTAGLRALRRLSR